MSSNKNNKKQASKALPIEKNQDRRLRFIDHSVRASIITFSVALLSLSFVSGAFSIFSTNPLEYAQAQSAPADPDAPTVELPGQGGNPQTPSARITNITRNAQSLSVEFSVSNFTNQLNSNHTNFYFNTEANTVTNKLFYGQSPYSVDVSLIPQGASQLCVIVANGSNTVITNSGNCFTIPAAASSNTDTTAPVVDTPLSPTVTGESIGVGGDTDGQITVTPADTNTNITNNSSTNITPQTQALNSAQLSGNTARSGGGLAVFTGLVLLSVIGYYVYYKVKGDRKAILKMEEKKIKVK